MSRRLAAVAVAVVLVMSGCAVGEPLPTTDVTDVSATLNANVYSNVVGDTEYWWRYGETTAYGSETPHRTVAIAANDESPNPVSEPLSGLTADTTYHVQLCVRDDEEDPPRTNCQSDRTFTTDPPPDGSLIAFVSDRDPGTEDDIFVMDSNGNHATNLTDSAEFESSPAVSPDRSKIAFTRDGQVWVMDADGDNQANVSDSATGDGEPTWSPDGDRIAFSRCFESCEIWVMDANGDNQAKLTDHTDGTIDSSPAWSPDGDQIAFVSDRTSTETEYFIEIWVMNANGSFPTALTNQGGVDPAWSPDGEKIAFSAFRDSGWEIYSMDADGDNETNVSNDPNTDTNPTWSPDGSKIAFSTLRDSLGDTNEIFVMDATDGSDQVNFTESNDSDDAGPHWSTAP